jgi:hypothetical protein
MSKCVEREKRYVIGGGARTVTSLITFLFYCNLFYIFDPLGAFKNADAFQRVSISSGLSLY